MYVYCLFTLAGKRAGGVSDSALLKQLRRSSGGDGTPDGGSHRGTQTATRQAEERSLQSYGRRSQRTTEKYAHPSGDGKRAKRSQ